MTRIDLTALSIEELWALHEEIAAVLAGRISAEKQKLEKRLEGKPVYGRAGHRKRGH